jgi:hypothetical protein
LKPARGGAGRTPTAEFDVQLNHTELRMQLVTVTGHSFGGDSGLKTAAGEEFSSDYVKLSI